MESEQIIAVRDIGSTYQVPLLLEEQGLRDRLGDILRLDRMPPLEPELIMEGQNLWTSWKNTTATKSHLAPVKIALVGKYTALPDSQYLPTPSVGRRHSFKGRRVLMLWLTVFVIGYLSVIKALEHSAMRCERKLNLVLIDADHLEEADATKHSAAWAQLAAASGGK